MRHITLLTCSLVILAWSADAFAGDCGFGRDIPNEPLALYPAIDGYNEGVETPDVPSNVAFVMSSGPDWLSGVWTDEDGVGLELFDDPELSRVLGASQGQTSYDVRRPAQPLEPGTRYGSSQCAVEGCSTFFVVGEPDVTPPEQARVTDLELLIYVNGHDGSGFSCADMEELRMRVLGSDDRTPEEDLIALAYIAPTTEELELQTEPQLVFPLVINPGASNEVRRSVRVELGVSTPRSRDGAHFKKADPYCFAIALMDRAGNIGARSEPECIWTTDTSAPYATVRDKTGGCSVPGGRAPATPWAFLVACAGVVMGWLRRRI